MKIAYFDCFAGAAGDMIAAALLDAGLDRNFLLSQLNSLNIEGLEIKIEQTSRCGLAALTFKPLFPHQHHHRNLDDVTGIINNSGISNDAKQTAVEIFENLAQAEAVVHGKAKEKIHFHEVGAVDSIVDIVAAAIGFHYFKDNGIDKFLCSKISIGSGSTQTEHGLMPVPAPATLELIKGVPVTAGPADFELLTPTAAAILKTIIDDYCPLSTVQVEKVGCGAGSKNPDSFPNILRLIIGQAVDSDEAEADCICLLETNIDDQTLKQSALPQTCS